MIERRWDEVYQSKFTSTNDMKSKENVIQKLSNYLKVMVFIHMSDMTIDSLPWQG